MNFLEKLFDFRNPGAKIKKYAETIFMVSVIAGGVLAVLVALVPLAVLIMSQAPFITLVLLAVPVLIVGVIVGAIIFAVILLVARISLLSYYGFGQLVESAENVEGLAKSKSAFVNDVASVDAVKSAITPENTVNVNYIPGNASQKFINQISVARLCTSEADIRQHLEYALTVLDDPAEKSIVEQLLKMPSKDLKYALKQIGKKYEK